MTCEVAYLGVGSARCWRVGRRVYRLLTPTLLLTAACTCFGCLAPVTDRLQAIHAELQLTRQEMAETNTRLSETNQRLAHIEELLKRFPFLRPASEMSDTANP